MRIALLVLAVIIAALSPASAQNAESEIRARFAQWTQDFNAASADKVCELFAKDLVSNYRGVPERGFERQCRILTDALTDKERKFNYALEIKEILPFGDIAIARVVWTLTIKKSDGAELKIVEPGLDVFRKEPDGQWRVFRYLSYDEG